MSKSIYQTFLQSRFRKPVAIVLIVIGFLALVTPFTPGSWLAFIGLELLGWRFLFPRRYMNKIRRKLGWKEKEEEDRTGS